MSPVPRVLTLCLRAGPGQPVREAAARGDGRGAAEDGGEREGGGGGGLGGGEVGEKVEAAVVGPGEAGGVPAGRRQEHRHHEGGQQAAQQLPHPAPHRLTGCRKGNSVEISVFYLPVFGLIFHSS